jgi:DNA polymerase-1
MKRILVDSNSVGYASHCATKLLSGGFETQSVFGMVKRARDMLFMNPEASELFLWDGHAQWRYDLLPVTADHPGYKGERDKDPKSAAIRESYKKARPVIQKALQTLGMRQLTVTSAEADDMAGFMVKTLDPSNQIELISGDQDWLQLVRANVTWYDPIRDVRINMNNFFEHTGYQNGFAFLEGKAFQGDGSDKIPPVGGIGKGTAPLFLAQFGTVQNFIDRVNSGDYVPKKKAEQNLGIKDGEQQKNYYRNMKLMNLLDVPRPTPQDVVYTEPQFDKEKFRLICERLNFASILRTFDSFIKPFEERRR